MAKMEKILIALVVVAAIFGAFAVFWPTGADYFYTYDRVARLYLAGETRLYDAAGAGYFNAPWLMALLAPLAQLPVQVGQAVLNTATVCLAGFGAWALLDSERRFAPVVLAVANLHTFDVLIRGQIDGLVLAAAVVAWLGVEREQAWVVALAFPVLLVKPQNVALVMLLCLRWAWRRSVLWPALAPTMLVFLLSGFAAGWDWPLRYLANFQATPPLAYLQTTVWRAAGALDGRLAWVVAAAGIAALLAWYRLGCTRKAFFVGLAANLVFTPYALGSHYILLAPVLAAVADRSLALGALAYLATLTPLLRLAHGFDVAWVDAAYPLALLVLVWAVLPGRVRERRDGVERAEAANGIGCVSDG